MMAWKKEHARETPGNGPGRRRAVFAALASVLLTVTIFSGIFSDTEVSASSRSFSLTPHCSHLSPIAPQHFHDRQFALAKVLQQHEAVTYIAEPGANALFYANVSQATWKLSERPLLITLTAAGEIQVLTPKFEATRSKLLHIPSTRTIRYVEWAEDEDPYTVLAGSLRIQDAPKRVFVDGDSRHFIVEGLQRALGEEWEVKSAPKEVASLRERKSEEELELMKCANEATVLAIRAVRKNLYEGIHESAASAMMRDALTEVGLKNGGCLTLFGENAALPHGRGTDRQLGKNEFALFDCTAQLHGYWSDVTRTVSLPQADIPLKTLEAWYAVRDAQIAALRQASRPNVTSGSVDAAARASLRQLRLDQYLTHRLGHGIGLEVHESPYLVGNAQHVLQSGNTFSDEPGVYIEESFGVRLEDCFVVTEHGAVPLTNGIGGLARHPWDP